eukprot:4103686-Alexandrium_andersonii.AAC.1
MGDGLGMGAFWAVCVVGRLRACFGQPSDPTNRCSHWLIRSLHEKWRSAHLSGASGLNFEVFPGSAQFKLRTPEAISHVPNAPGAPSAKWHLCVGTFVFFRSQ